VSEPRGYLVAKVGKVGSTTDREPFAIDCDFGGPGPWPILLSDFGHSCFATVEPPVGSGRVELIGSDLIAEGELWLETPRGLASWQMLKRLGPQARFSVSFHTLQKRRNTLTSVRLLEASCVLAPAEESTRLVELKDSRDEVELALAEWRQLAAHKALVARYRKEHERQEWLELQQLARQLMARQSRGVAA
jgi:hypothetical protein